jgi:biopolymer transport protein ExbD
MRVERRHTTQPGFMLAPMIDMTFLLLIFFMVTTKISKEQIKMDIKLPIAANAVLPDDLANRDIINISGDGTYFLKSTSVTRQELSKYLKQRFEDYPPLRIYVRADRKTPGKKIKELMRLAAEAGAIDVIFGSYQKE